LDGDEEWFKVEEKVLFCNPHVPIQKIQHLSFHQVHFRYRETEALVSLDAAIVCPMLVLRTRVIEVFGCEDKGSEEDSVDGASHALGNRWETSLKTGKVHERAHESGNLDLGSVDKRCDERFE